MSDLNISAQVSKKASNTIILSLEGFLDGATSPRLEDITNKIFAKNCYKIIFDLSQLNYISSAGIGLFTAINKTVSDKGGAIRMAALPESIAKVFDLLGFTILFTFAETVEEAEEDLAGSQ